MVPRVRVLAILLSSLVAAPPWAWSWGREGHRIVARIAARNLTAEARQKLAQILGTDDDGLEEAMAAAATWPDEIDKTETGTRNWHFIDGPAFGPFSHAGLCPHHNCIVDRIEDISMRLRTNKGGFKLKHAPDPFRPRTSQEVGFLVHFVGDIHQPLHAATNGDRGGNCVALVTPIPHGLEATTELHGLWDRDEVLAAMAADAATSPAHGSAENQATQLLFDRYNAMGGPQPWETAGVFDWARESNALARSDVYAQLAIPQRTANPGQCALGIVPIDVGSAYLSGNVADVNEQLMRAGIRLSDLLNSICAGTGCQSVD